MINLTTGGTPASPTTSRRTAQHRTAARPAAARPVEPARSVEQAAAPSPTPAPETPAPSGVRPATLRRRQVVADAGAVTAGVFAALAIADTVQHGQPTTDGALTAAITGIGWMLCLALNRLYLARNVERLGEELKRIIASGLAAGGLTMIVTFVAGIEPWTSWIVVSSATVGTLLVAERLVARWAFARMRASGLLRRRVAIIGTDANARELFESVRSNESLGYDIVGYIAVDEVGRSTDTIDDGTVLGHLDDAEQILHTQDCVGAMVSLNSVDGEQVNSLARKLTDAGFHVTLSTSLRDFDVTRLRPQAVGNQPLVYLEPTIREGWRSHAKRAFDVFLAAVGIVVTAPIVAGAAVAIRLDSRGPVFFRQTRVGRDGAEFEMIKLRTMSADAEAQLAAIADLNESDGPLFKVADDPRITRVGRILRRTSIDELPQFWNVLRGDMSMVGPRPALPSEVVEWDPELRDRLRVLPGVTGIWQVSGRSSTSFAEYKRLDLYYVDNWSLLHDVKIVFKTIGVVLLQRGAS